MSLDYLPTPQQDLISFDSRFPTRANGFFKIEFNLKIILIGTSFIQFLNAFNH